MSVEREAVVHRKLVRDRIPEIVEAAGRVPATRVLTVAELVPALLAKLHEEATELGLAEPEERLEELADVHEVLSALTTAYGFTEEDVTRAAREKKAARGGFSERVWLEEVR
ncbi:phosphoribosyl-ATP pyrophosphohydrolase [Micromonospora sp. NPDC049497]|uniref:phosphoribosyl-ATP pyrophosphohydrolase n=1 Tax=Micromonospora sp. NPDC049497 TaxID=3364273 RepID=UPI00379CB4EE